MSSCSSDPHFTHVRTYNAHHQFLFDALHHPSPHHTPYLTFYFTTPFLHHTPSPTSACLQVNFWDIRVDRLMKKGRKPDADMSDLIWRPSHSVPLVSLLGERGVRKCGHMWGLYEQAGCGHVGPPSHSGPLVSLLDEWMVESVELVLVSRTSNVRPHSVPLVSPLPGGTYWELETSEKWCEHSHSAPTLSTHPHLQVWS